MRAGNFNEHKEEGMTGLGCYCSRCKSEAEGTELQTARDAVTNVNLSREQFENMVVFMFGSFEMRHRTVEVWPGDTLILEGILSTEGYLFSTVNGCYFVPVIDVLWARAQLEGFPNGGDSVLADHPF
jgi:hypothetical protein